MTALLDRSVVPDSTTAKQTTGAADKNLLCCPLCGLQTDAPDAADIGTARGNTARFLGTVFKLWRCPRCGTIKTLGKVDYRDIYSDYPLNERRLDAFARGTYTNLLRRLKQCGLKENDRLLDYGCGNGVLLKFLREKGYENADGYDPYTPDFAARPERLYDCVVANDVIEHTDDPRAFIRECAALVKPGGLLYIGTADAAGVEMNDLEPHLMRLHLPFHRTIFTEESLHTAAYDAGLARVRSWQRSYMDTQRPFSNYRFLDELNKVLGHNVDKALSSEAPKAFLRRPLRLMFYGFFGSWFPSAYEPAIALRKP